MILLTDIPDSVTSLFGRDPAWVETKGVKPQSICGRLRLGMGMQGTVWVSEVREWTNPFWDALVIKRESDESQFDLVQKNKLLLPPRTACIALEGRNFHGLRNRSWSAELGNLHFSASIQSSLIASRAGFGLTMLPAVAVVETIKKMSTHIPEPGIKWVNDILCDGKKVSGVLTATDCESNLIRAQYLGIGLNLAVAPKVTSTPFVPATGCLAEWDEQFQDGLIRVLEVLMEVIAEEYRHLVEEGPCRLLEKYRGYSCVLGRKVRIWPEGTIDIAAIQPDCEGVVESILPDLSLRLEGCKDPVTRGRLAFVKPF